MEFLIEQEKCLLLNTPIRGVLRVVGVLALIWAQEENSVRYRHVDCPHFSQARGEDVETGLD